MSSNAVTLIPPEEIEIANAYLQYQDVDTTAEQLMIPRYEVVKALQTPAVKKYLDGIYLDQAYRNRSKINSILDKIVDEKLQEAEDSGMYTKKDLVEVLTLMHKIRIDELKLTQEKEKAAGQTIQIANVSQFGDSAYGKLMESLIGPSKME